MTSTTAASRALYRGLWRQVRRFQDEALPITGVVGLDAGPVCLDPLARLRAAFGGGGGGDAATSTTTRLSEGLQALRTLPHQAAALGHAEEDARALLARWAQLQARWAELRRRKERAGALASPSSSSPSPPIINTRVLEAGEEACALAYAATEEQAAENALDDDEADEIRARARRVLALADPANGDAEAARDLAERARRAVVLSASSSPSRYPTPHVQAAAAASAALFAYDNDDDGGGGGANSNNDRLRSEPVEWVYDGIEAALPQPLLAGESAHSQTLSSTASGTSSGPPSRAARKGVPIALALAAARCLVDAKLPGLVRCEPVCTRDKDAEMLAAGRAEQRGSQGGGGGGVNAGPLSALPAAVAARQAGRTVAVAPATNTWLVRLDIEDKSSWYVDVTKRGELLSADEAKERYPSLQEEHETEEQATLALWREVARTLVLAHQRRGEADAVASWMRAAMALDPAAAEWGRVL
jgi:hypothetical protein